ncbi:hypothetical protein ACLMJK_008460 [Lecanora helva]
MNSTTNHTQWHSQQSRPVTEILISAVLMGVATINIARHLATFRKQPSHVASYQIMATALVPTFALGDLLISVYRTMKIGKRTGWEHDRRYYLCSALDMRATAAVANDESSKRDKPEEAASEISIESFHEVSVPLHLIPYHNLDFRRESPNMKRYIWIMMLLAYSAYAFVTIILWIRRAQYGARTFLDDYTALTAFGGFITALSALGILTLNTAWEAPERYAVKFEQQCTEPTPAELFLNIAYRAVLPELQLSLVMAVFLQSMFFFMSRSGFVADLATGSSCTTWNRRWSSEGKMMLIPTSAGLEWTTWEPRPCKPWNEGGITNTVAIFAEFGYMVAFIVSLSPIIYMLGFLLQAFAPEGGILNQLGRRVLWGKYTMVNSAGGLYLLLSYGLACIAVWDITSPRAWEPWMWKDPWTAAIWPL